MPADTNAQHAAAGSAIPETIVIASGTVGSSSRPFFFVPLTLKTIHSQQVLTRAYIPAAEGMFSLSVILPAINSRGDKATDTDEVQDAIYKRIDEFAAELNNEHARLAKMAEANGVPLDGINYSAIRNYSIQVTSPRANGLVRLVADFDKLMELLDILWLTGTIKEQHYSSATYDWKRRALRVAIHVRNVANRAMAAANRARQARAAQAGKGAGNPSPAGDAENSDIQDADELIDIGDNEIAMNSGEATAAVASEKQSGGAKPSKKPKAAKGADAVAA
jgi:hypothetical protein